MNKGSKQTLISIALIIAGFVAVFFLSELTERNRPALPAGYEDEDLSLQGAKLKGYAFGFEGLIADWYWMKSLQYIGNKVLNSKEDLSMDNLDPLNPRLLYPYLDNATTLDPKFMSVYEYGAVVLPAIDQEQAIKLTRKGIENNPNSWRLYHYLGFIYWRLGDYEKAAETYQQGSQIAGAADFMKSMAAKMKSEGGSRDTAREIYRQMFEEAQDAQAKENAALHLSALDSLDERELVQKKLDEFKLQNRRCANNWREITPLLQTVKLPANRNFRVDNSGSLVDPSGASYVLDKENCVITLARERTKIPLQ
jgi:tetratricopeptide (TPR) repeat protein